MTELCTDIPCPACGEPLIVGADIEYDPEGGRYLERWIECRKDGCKHWTDEASLWQLKGMKEWIQKVTDLHYSKHPSDMP